MLVVRYDACNDEAFDQPWVGLLYGLDFEPGHRQIFGQRFDLR